MAWLSFGNLTHELHDGEVIVGSGSEATWRVATADLMPRHFVVLVHGLNASVRPFRTENIVVVNEQQLSGAPHALNEGDVIAAGSGRFVYTEEVPRIHPPPPKSEAMAYLVDEHENKAYRLASRSTGIGRDGSNAVVIRDPTASRFHAEVRREAGGFALHPRGSAGTLVNKRRIGSPSLLEDGDLIEIAYTTLRFTTQMPAATLAMAPTQVQGNDETARRPTEPTERISPVRHGAAVPSRAWRGLAILAAIIIGTLAMWLFVRGG